MNSQATQNIKVIISFLKKILSKFKPCLCVMFIVGLIWAIDLSVRRYVVKDFIDRVFMYHAQDSFMPYIFPISIYMLLSITITSSFRLYGYFVDVRMVPLLNQQIADFAFNKLLKQSHLFYQNNLTGDITHKVNNLVDGTIEIIKISIDRFFAYSVALILGIYMLLLVEIKFALFTLLWVGLFLVAIILWFPLLRNLASNYTESSTKVTANLADNLHNISSIRLFSNQKYSRLQFFHKLKEKIAAERKLHYAYFWVWFVYGYSFDILQAINFYFIVQGLKQGLITLGDISLILSINVAIVDLMNRVTADITQFSESYGKTINALNLLMSSQVIEDKANASELKVVNGNIRFKEVIFAYPNKQPIFDQLSIDIKPLERVGLVGYSGSGKSTFIGLLLRLFDVTKGTITIDEYLIDKVTQASLRKNISVVPQDFNLFNTSILKNIKYGNILATDEQIIEAARFAGIHNLITSLPQGYDTLVGERGMTLSGGEKQRIIIARSFLKNAPILILDEATNQLDAITEREIQTTLFKLMSGKTSIVIAHRLSTLLHMDRILVFDKGRIIEDGTHRILITQNGLYSRLWKTQNGDVIQY
jgi:ATP-binding cassette subfamily B protein